MFYTSVYLSLSPEDRADRPPRFLLRYKTLMKKYKESGNIDDVVQDFQRIEDFLSNPKNLQSEEGIPVRGIAIFSNSKEDYWEVFRLPYVIKNMLVVDVEPYKRGIFAIEADFGKNLIVDFSKKHIHAYMIDTYTVEVLHQDVDFSEKIERAGTTKFLTGGSASFRTTGTRNVELIKYEEESKVARFIAETIFTIYKDKRFDNLFLSSPDKKIISLVVNELHPYIKRTYRGTLNLPHNANKNEIYNALLDKLKELDLKDEESLADKFEEMVAFEMAIKGLQPSIDMAMIGNINTLIVDVDFSKEGFICYPSGFYGVFGDCPENTTGKIITPDITNKLIEEVLKQGGRVEIANTDKLRKVINHGVGAILRWKIESKV